MLFSKLTSTGQSGDIQSPKRDCSEYRNILVQQNSFTLPVKEHLLAFNGLKSKLPPPLQCAFASPTRPNPGGGETCAETGINVFFSKIVKLAAVRINGLVERLQLSQQIRESVYCLVQQILNQRTTLFFNRHIDQIILCSLYGVAKKMEQEHVDIIPFYNEIFIPAVKPLLVELGPAGATPKANRVPEVNNTDGQCPGSPRLTQFPSLPDMSPKKVSAAHSVYVSPLRSSKVQLDRVVTAGPIQKLVLVAVSLRWTNAPTN